MTTLSIADETKPLQEVSLDWIVSTISRNRIMDIRNCVVVEIESEKIDLRLTANCEDQRQANSSNEFESRIMFLWKDLVLSEDDLDPHALYDFLQRMDQWVAYEPKK
ncbi:MAG: hypothetical protein U5K31_13825 [Balneolaceae bacterium]|nr:hypothetical protein [Balneolaceae bacterium]